MSFRNPMKIRHVNSFVSSLFFACTSPVLLLRPGGRRRHSNRGKRIIFLPYYLGDSLGILGVFGGKGNKGFGLMGTDEGAIRGHVTDHWRHRQQLAL